MNEVVHVGPSEPGVDERIAEYNSAVRGGLAAPAGFPLIAKLDDGRIVWARPFGLASNEVGLAMANVRTGPTDRVETHRIPVYNIWLQDTPAPPWVAATVAAAVTPLSELLAPVDGDSDG